MSKKSPTYSLAIEVKGLGEREHLLFTIYVFVLFNLLSEYVHFLKLKEKKKTHYNML